MILKQTAKKRESCLDFVLISIAFIFGLLSRAISLPPLVGFLIAGFILHALGFKTDATIQTLADMGVTLMLFTIGIKLDPRELIRKEVLVGSAGHMLLWVIIGSASVWSIGAILVAVFPQFSLQQMLLIIFALSFSSTVAVVKTLDEGGEMKTEHANLSLAILVAQDVIAVVYLSASHAALPSPLIILLPLLWLVRPIIFKIISIAGHGELMPLMGLVLAMSGYHLFDAVSLKGDLGALAMGMLVSQSNKSTEIYKALMNIKDLFLIGFFLSIGLTALPNLQMLQYAFYICLLLPLKGILFYGIFTLLKMRIRTAFLTTVVMTNFSEFGLIVGAQAVKDGMLSDEWLVTLAISVTISFILTSVVYSRAHHIFATLKPRFEKFIPEAYQGKRQYVIPANVQALVVGMGRVGKGAYSALDEHFGDNRVWGTDADKGRVVDLHHDKYRVCYADAEDPELWAQMGKTGLEIVVIALPRIRDIMNIAEMIRHNELEVKIVALARYVDQHEELRASGIDLVYNFYTEAGVGLVNQSLDLLDKPLTDAVSK